MENNYEIIDDNGTIHSGTEDEMRLAWDVMTGNLSGNYTKREIKELEKEYDCEFTGDLKLIQVIDIYR